MDGAAAGQPRSPRGHRATQPEPNTRRAARAARPRRDGATRPRTATGGPWPETVLRVGRVWAYTSPVSGARAAPAPRARPGPQVHVCGHKMRRARARTNAANEPCTDVQKS